MTIRPGWNALDRQLKLTPRDYAVNPHAYGQDPQLAFHVPPGGDDRSMRVAIQQHRLVLRWRRSRRPAARVLVARYGFSKQVLSRICLGERWAGAVGTAALLDALPPGRQTESRPASW